MAPTLNPGGHETGRKEWIVVRPVEQYEKARSVGDDEGGGEGGKGVGKGGGNDGKRGIKRGDIVTFWKPRKPEELGIKRVIGVEGDIIYPSHGYATSPTHSYNRLGSVMDGLPEPNHDSVVREEVGKVIVPYGHIWVEGDNAEKSLDSRDNGPISKGLVLGKAVWVWRAWGFERIGDGRGEAERRRGSRVERGRGGLEVPGVFLE